jgi:hypothetical protein
MPANNSLGLNEDQSSLPSRPEASQHDPEESIAYLVGVNQDDFWLVIRKRHQIVFKRGMPRALIGSGCQFEVFDHSPDRANAGALR